MKLASDMPRSLAMLLLCGLLACNNVSDNSGNADSTIRSIDSNIRAGADTIKKAVDTAVRKIDSAGGVLADSVKSRFKRAAMDVKKAVK